MMDVTNLVIKVQVYFSSYRLSQNSLTVIRHLDDKDNSTDNAASRALIQNIAPYSVYACTIWTT